MKKQVLWIARDKDNRLFIYEEKPYKKDDEIFACEGFSDYWQLAEELYPKVTFENSPKQLIIKED